MKKRILWARITGFLLGLFLIIAPHSLYPRGKPAPGNQVVLIMIQGGGHSWPGSVIRFPEKMPGRTSEDFSAPEVIWSFLKKQRRHFDR